MNRSQRCGVCQGCQAKACGQCVYCADSPQFGGPGVKKQSCLERRCHRVLENRLQRDAPSFKAKAGCNLCDECRHTPDCQVCLVCLDRKFFQNRYLPGAMCAKKRCNQSRAIDLPPPTGLYACGTPSGSSNRSHVQVNEMHQTSYRAVLHPDPIYAPHFGNQIPQTIPTMLKRQAVDDNNNMECMIKSKQLRPGVFTSAYDLQNGVSPVDHRVQEHLINGASNGLNAMGYGSVLVNVPQNEDYLLSLNPQPSTFHYTNGHSQSHIDNTHKSIPINTFIKSEHEMSDSNNNNRSDQSQACTQFESSVMTNGDQAKSTAEDSIMQSIASVVHATAATTSVIKSANNLNLNNEDFRLPKNESKRITGNLDMLGTSINELQLPPAEQPRSEQQFSVVTNNSTSSSNSNSSCNNTMRQMDEMSFGRQAPPSQQSPIDDDERSCTTPVLHKPCHYGNVYFGGDCGSSPLIGQVPSPWMEHDPTNLHLHDLDQLIPPSLSGKNNVILQSL